MAEQTVPPETRYAQLGRDRLAHQILGQGPPDLVFTMGSFSHVDMVWDDPQVALFLRRLASVRAHRRFVTACAPLRRAGAAGMRNGPQRRLLADPSLAHAVPGLGATRGRGAGARSTRCRPPHPTAERQFFDTLLRDGRDFFDLFDLHLYGDGEPDPGRHRDGSGDDARVRL